MNNLVTILMLLSLWASQALAGAPAGRNTSVSISYDRPTPPLASTSGCMNQRVTIRWIRKNGGVIP